MRNILKGILAAGLLFTTVNSFADVDLVGIVCPDAMCKCDYGSTSCCGANSCTFTGSSCVCT